MEQNNCEKDQQNCCSSTCMMKCPKGRCCLAIGVNILFFIMWYSNVSLITMILNLFIGFMSFNIIMTKIKGENPQEKEKECCSTEQMQARMQKKIEKAKEFKAYLDSVASLKDTSLTIEFFVTVYILTWITSIFSMEFLLWVIANLVILHEPINKRYPDFMFYSYLYVKQMIEGVLGLIECLIPKYEEEEAKENK